jgi:predicted protein tyrosine phosphatase
MNLAIQICKASEAADLVAFKEKEGVAFHAVISIEHPSDEKTPVEEGGAPRLDEIIGPQWKDRQLILKCWDAPGPEFGVAMPDPQLVDDAIAHAKKWKPEQGDYRLLIHCNQGRSRSPAIALLLMRYFRGVGTAQQCLDDLLLLRPQAVPNASIVEHGDAILHCEGELIRVFQEDPRLAEGHRARRQARQRRLAEGEAPS